MQQTTSTAILQAKHMDGYLRLVKEAKIVADILVNKVTDVRKALENALKEDGDQEVQSFLGITVNRLEGTVNQLRAFSPEANFMRVGDTHAFIDDCLRIVRMANVDGRIHLESPANIGVWELSHILYLMAGNPVPGLGDTQLVKDFVKNWVMIDTLEILRREIIMVTVSLLHGGTPINGVDYLMQIGTGLVIDERFDQLNRMVANIHAYCLMQGLDLKKVDDRKKFIATLTDQMRAAWAENGLPWERNIKMPSLPEVSCFDLAAVFMVLRTGRLENKWYEHVRAFLNDKAEII